MYNAVNNADRVHAVTEGFWLMSLDIRRINHSGIITSSQGCCFKSSKPTQPDDSLVMRHVAQHAQHGAADAPVTLSIDLCQRDWLVISPVHCLEELQHIEARLQECQRLSKLQRRAMEIAIRRATACTVLLPHGKVNLQLLDIYSSRNHCEK